MERLVCLLVGYAFGCFPTGYIYAKIHGVDIRKKGSGNIGSTNVLRNMGPKAGLITMLGDFAKTMLPIFIISQVFKTQPELRYLYMVYTGLGAILGHNYPITLGFKGGKGVACTGAMIILSDPIIFAVCLVLFLGTVLTTKYVSLGSLLVAAGYFITNMILIYSGSSIGWGAGSSIVPEYRMELSVVVAIVSALIVFQHRSNIVRLLNGNENKLSFGNKK